MRALRTSTLAAAAAAILTLGACASGGGNGAAPADRSSHMREATVVVQNQNWQDVVVYVVQSGHRMRLGMVTAMTTSKFRLPQRFLGSASDIRLLADPIGSTQGYQTEGLRVLAGQQVAFNVQNRMSLSSVAIWDR